MEHFQLRFHSHGDSLSTQKLNSGFHQGFLFRVQCIIIVMRCSNVQLVGSVFVGVPIVWYIQAIVPPFGGHDRSAIISIMVQSCFYERFVMVGIGLWADECPVQSHIDLSEEGVCQIVGQSHDVCCQQIGSVVFLGHEFHFEITLRQVDEVFLRIHLEIHGIDPRIELIDSHKTSRGHAEIRGWYFEHVQSGITDSRRTGVGYHVRHRRRFFPRFLFLLVLFRAACNHWRSGCFDRDGRNMAPLYTRLE